MTGAEPLVVLAVAGIAAGASVQAYGQYQQNKTAQGQAKAQSAWNLYNSKVAKREAEAEQAANLFESKQQKKAADRLKARGRAIRGASGVDVEGSPLLVMEDTAEELAKEQQQTRISGTRRVSALESQSILDVSRASAAKARASGFGRAAPISAGGTLLSGAGSAAGVAAG
jgi:Tfp pilus assembly protein PilE